jgi:hypothetical protein
MKKRWILESGLLVIGMLCCSLWFACVSMPAGGQAQTKGVGGDELVVGAWIQNAAKPETIWLFSQDGKVSIKNSLGSSEATWTAANGKLTVFIGSNPIYDYKIEGGEMTCKWTGGTIIFTKKE